MRRLGLKHRRTRPYTPRTNGKAERFIQTSLREWAYARSYDDSDQRAAHLMPWLHAYNWHRPHASLDYKPPISRIPLPMNNVLGLHNFIWHRSLLRPEAIGPGQFYSTVNREDIHSGVTE